MSSKQVPHGPENMDCPVWRKAMSEVCHKCPMWIQLRGKHPQTDQEVDEWQCAYAVAPIINLEVARNVRQVQAATESFRNEMVKGQAQLLMQNERQFQLDNPTPNGHDDDQMKLLEN